MLSSRHAWIVTRTGIHARLILDVDQLLLEPFGRAFSRCVDD
jgi:hypothetical protein